MMFNVEFNEDSCHICLSNDGTKEHISENDFKQKYMELTSVEVLHAKGMPSYICEFCKSKLVIAVHFKKQCMMSHKMLQKYFEEIIQAENTQCEKIEVIETLEETRNHNVFVPEQTSDEIVSAVEIVNEVEVSEEAVEKPEIKAAKKRKHIAQKRRVTRPKKQKQIELIELEEIEDEKEEGEMEQTTIEAKPKIVVLNKIHNDKKEACIRISHEQLQKHLEGIVRGESAETETIEIIETLEETENHNLMPQPILEEIVPEVEKFNEVEELEQLEEKAVDRPEIKLAKKYKQFAQSRRVTRPKKQKQIELIEMEEIEDEEEEDEIEQMIEVEKDTTEPKIIELENYQIEIGSDNEDDEGKNHNDKKETCIRIIELKGMKNIERTTDGKKYKVFDGKRVSYMSLCPICNKMQFNIKQHMSVHTGEKKHKCPHCDKAFAQKGNLNHHINIHTGNKPYQCKVCDKSFSEPNSLRSHMVFHTQEKKYHCEVCGKKFGYPHTLTAHKRTHTNERPYSCDICNKSFLVRHTLTKHIRSHTGEKPYKCETCGKAFTSSGNLSAHRVVHTKIRRFDCHICPMKFSYKNVLKTHMKVHKIGLEDTRDPDEVSVVTETEENTESE